MKSWATAHMPGVCAFDRDHRWKAGDRIVQIQGKDWPKPKLFCASCGIERHQMSADTARGSGWSRSR